jgi:hypothetical protein
MIEQLSVFVDRVSEFFAHRKGLLPIIGILLVLLNLLLQVLFPSGWLTQINCFLHLGVLVAIIGFMLARAL